MKIFRCLVASKSFYISYDSYFFTRKNMKYIVFMHIHVQSSVEGIFIFRRLQLSSNAYELQEHFFLASKIPSIIHMNWVKECKAYMYFFIAAGYLKEGNKLSSFSNLSSTFHSLLTWIPTKFSCILNYCWYLIRKGLYWWLHHWSWATYTLHCIWKKNQENLIIYNIIYSGYHVMKI